MSKNLSRRSVLRTGATAGGTVVLGSLAGCEQFTGDDSDAETTEADDGDDGDDEPSNPFRQWLPEPDALDEEHYFFRSVDYGQLRQNEANFDPEVYDNYTEDEGLFRELDFSVADVDWVGFIPPVLSDTPAVVSGSFSADDVVDPLTEEGYYEEDGEIGEYTLYTEGGGEVAVTDGTFVITGDPDSGHARTLIETKNGERPRYTDASGELETLLEPFGTETFVGGTTRDPVTDDEADPESLQFAGQVGYAFGDAVEGETTTTEILVMFETEDDVDMDAISEYTGGELFSDHSDITATQAGRMVTVTGETPTDELYT